MPLERPLLRNELSRVHKPSRAKKPKQGLELVLATIDAQGAAARSVELRRANGRVELVRRVTRIGERAFPPRARAVSVERTEVLPVSIETTGFRPAHLDFRPVPRKLAQDLRQPNRVRALDLEPEKNMGLPTSVFSPDDRATFDDTAYPWSTCGRVDTAAGWGSGVMVGPRHLLTASHVVNWRGTNPAGWLKFTPSRFDTSEPFGSAYANTIYFFNQANGSDGIDEVECAFDYVVCVLDTRIGDVTGWMGSTAYLTSWDGGAYWGHVGYPTDLASGQRPAFIGYEAMDSTFAKSLGWRESFGIRHKIDAIPGHSGGPYFGWWDNEPCPRVVASQSAEKWGGATGPNTCAGGAPLPEMINWARTAEP